MKRFLISIFALILAAAVPVFSYGEERDGQGSETSVFDAPVENVAIETASPVENAAAAEDSSEENSPESVKVELYGEGEVEDIAEYFEKNGYPEFVSYAFKVGDEMRKGEDGADVIYSNWEIGVVNATEEQKREIIALAAPTCCLEFKQELFYHSEKVIAYDFIIEMNDPNISHVVFEKNGSQVQVYVPEELQKEYAQLLIRDLDLGAVVSVYDESMYGADVAMAGIDGFVSEEQGGFSFDTVVTDTGAEAFNWWILAVCLLFVLLAGVLIIFFRRSRMAQTTEGTVVSSARLTRRKVRELVKNSMEQPDERVLERIKEKI